MTTNLIGVMMMKQAFTARVFQEGNWFIAQCLEVDVASQGETQDEALSNLREALELHFEPPSATIMPELQKVEVEINAA
ncbi:MAG: type II toxin-antitoxin system HicB family antitoxin [Waterburya sp.]